MTEQAQKEPTMEEILSSIRKIIASDDGEDEKTGEDLQAVSEDYTDSDEDELGVFSDLETDDEAAEPDLIQSESEMDTDDLLEAMRHDHDEETDDVFDLSDNEQDEDAEIMSFSDFRDELTMTDEAEEADAEFTEEEDDEADSWQAESLIQTPELTQDTLTEDTLIEDSHMSASEDESFDDGDQDEYISEETVPSEPDYVSQFQTGEVTMSQTLSDDRTVMAAAGSLSKLLDTVDFSPPAGGQRTLDDVIQDLLRPMLKEWLDENLQSLVERCVEAEIQRIGRRAG